MRGGESWRPSARAMNGNGNCTSAGASANGSSGSANGNASVDLAELEKLRTLVKYEFDDPVTTNELMAALRFCHNNTKEAYRYLKARRHSAMALSAPTVMVAAAPDSGTKRRGEDVSEDATGPAKKRRDGRLLSLVGEAESNSATAHGGTTDSQAAPGSQQEAVTDLTPMTQLLPEEGKSQVVVDLVGGDGDDDVTFVRCSGGNDDEEFVEVSQKRLPMEVKSESTSVRDLVVCVVDDRLNHRPVNDAQWLASVWHGLHVETTPDVASLLVSACDAFAASLRGLPSDTLAKRKLVYANLLLDVLLLLPSTDKSDELRKKCVPTVEEIEAQDAEVEKTLAFSQQNQEKSAHARSQSAKNVINSLSAACGSYLAQLSWFANASRDATQHTEQVNEALQAIAARLQAMIKQVMVKSQSAQIALANARKQNEDTAKKIREAVLKRKEELVQAGRSEAIAELEAYSQTLSSANAEIVALLSSRNDADAVVAQRKKEAQQAEKALAFYQLVGQLVDKVTAARRAALDVALRHHEVSRKECEKNARRSLKRYIPLLARTLQQFNEFHTLQQAKAGDELKLQREALEVHTEIFGDSAPIRKEDIEKRIREFLGVIDRSKQVMCMIADSQKRLWTGKRNVLPPDVFDVLLQHYGMLWRSFNGAVRQVMKSLVDNMEDQAPAVDQITTQVGFAFSPTAADVMMASPVEEKRPAASSASPSEVVPIPNGNLTRTGPVSNAGKQATVMESTSVEISPLELQPNWSATLSPVKVEHEQDQVFATGTVWYTKFNVGGNDSRFFRGKITKQLDDGTYSVEYEDGDVYSIAKEFLLTKEQMEQDLRARADVGPENDAANSGGTCTIM
ncbi:TPA: hypothetical protein N0F65_002418 [Lagenidium giganteum]|uniref:Uncharacterized protein n=1 Tax=Lagenidium giganteum TaxID=4803 RepID=A0AAV2YIJ4_9STRA|nr:TPA: hypothetical protein N0F65_002418 [Lagenidium giganteum]